MSLFSRRRKPAAPPPPLPPPEPPAEAPALALPSSPEYEIPYAAPPPDTVSPLDSFASVRLTRARELLVKADVERRIARCVDALLGADELPMNPYPTLARLLRLEELPVPQTRCQTDLDFESLQSCAPVARR